MTVLITGGAGFIGSHLAHALTSPAETVLVLDDLSGGYRTNVPQEATLIVGDCADADLVNDLFATHRPDVVYHLAAYAAEGLSPFIRRYNYRNNLEASATLINAAINYDVQHFVFTSSMAVYGAQPVPFREDMPFAPVDPYGIAKAAVEQDLAVAAAIHGLPYTIFRPHNVYGPHQNIADAYRNVVGIFMNQAMQGEPLTIFGDGHQTRAFSYISDILNPLLQAPDLAVARNRTFNLGGRTPYRIRDLAAAVLDCVGDGLIVHEPPRHEVKDAWCDHTALDTAFGPQPETPLPEGLARMWDWATHLGPQPTPPFAAIEIAHELPPKWRTLCPSLSVS